MNYRLLLNEMSNKIEVELNTLVDFNESDKTLISYICL